MDTCIQAIDMTIHYKKFILHCHKRDQHILAS
jgi:hypothetical protein